MITEQQYVILSLELNMFFGRIMKEHSLFLEAGFTPANPDFSHVADQYKQQFESILHNAVVLGNGIISLLWHPPVKLSLITPLAANKKHNTSQA
ncbi:DUF2935 domain-containing protein [Lacrimispora celerecrescens]|uniref:DUF2935 domain-containing protein n=1 Tax=Lacrimispora celerecrescens TaxID=29354 RepID=UPI002E8E3F82|nr:DUF2935 domain-containing protein [Lacrimispora celerecrescens]